MVLPYLAVTTGFPCAGKTKVSTYLQEELGFTRLSTDDFRRMFFGVVDYSIFQNDPQYEQRERIMFNLLEASRRTFVANGLDVVVDSSAPNNRIRAGFLNTVTEQGVFRALKSLIYVKADEAILRQRNLDKGRSNDPISEWKKFWEEPDTSLGSEIVIYDNNSTEDLNQMYVDLDRRFKRIKSFYMTSV